MSALRWLRAPNPGPFTLDGTRTYVVGQRRVAVVDPGPDLEDHVRGIVALVRDAEHVTLVPTHGHDDHAGSVERLVQRLGRARRVEVVGAGHPLAARPDPVRGIFTDAGPLLAVPTPGHTVDHLAFHWPEGRALFAGDLLLGEGDTTWVGEYAGCVADYLQSLARVRVLSLERVYPAHGPDLTDPTDAIRRHEAHRRTRIEQVREAMDREPGLDEEALFAAVYGDRVPAGLERAALASLRALREYVDSEGGGPLSSGS